MQLCVIIFNLFLLSWMPWAGGQMHCTYHPYQIIVPVVTPWGDWGNIDRCPKGSHASGFSIKVERSQGSGDDTALNGLRLFCYDNNNNHVKTIESAVGRWGQWTSMKKCTSGKLTSYKLRIESKQGDGDDTSVNNIRFTCTGQFGLEGDGMTWGSWGPWSCDCPTGICGIQTRVEGPQGSGDDTALNHVIFYCC